jgi:hypothetical protein
MTFRLAAASAVVARASGVAFPADAKGAVQLTAPDGKTAQGQL